MPEPMEDLKYNFGCASCGYRQISEGDPIGSIDVSRMISRLDACFDRNDLAGAERLLRYWREEAIALRDLRGELSVVNEQIGLYRRLSQQEPALEAVERGLTLIDSLGMEDHVSAATVYLNAATTLKAFGEAVRALPIYEKAERVYRRELPADHPLVAGFYNNYALTLVDFGRYSEAELCFHRAAAIMESRQDSLPEAAVTHVNLAQMYRRWEQKTSEEALTEMERALTLLRDARIPHNSNYAFVLSKCAPAFREMGYEREADLFDDEAKKIYAGN